MESPTWEFEYENLSTLLAKPSRRAAHLGVVVSLLTGHAGSRRSRITASRKVSFSLVVGVAYPLIQRAPHCRYRSRAARCKSGVHQIVPVPPVSRGAASVGVA